MLWLRFVTHVAHTDGKLCIERLQERFPTSIRVVALQGSLLESRGLFDQAIKLYESILVHEPSNIVRNPVFL